MLHILIDRYMHTWKLATISQIVSLLVGKMKLSSIDRVGTSIRLMTMVSCAYLMPVMEAGLNCRESFLTTHSSSEMWKYKQLGGQVDFIKPRQSHIREYVGVCSHVHVYMSVRVCACIYQKCRFIDRNYLLTFSYVQISLTFSLSL